MDALDDVLQIEKQLVQKATFAHIPLGGTFELLPLCNMHCEMCYIRMNQAEINAAGERLRTVEEWLQIAEQMKQRGTLFLLLTGGEPFLYPGFSELYRGLKKMGMILTINTNGTLITEEIAQLLGEDKPRRVNITLYGASNETYEKICHTPHGFDQTIRGIRLLQQQGVDVKLNGTLVPENQHELEQLYRIAAELGLYLKVDSYLFPLQQRSRKKFNPQSRLAAQQAAHCYLQSQWAEHPPEWFMGYREYTLNHVRPAADMDTALHCRAGKSSFWIRWDGKMTPCVFMDNPAVDVFAQGFDQAWATIVEQTKELCLPPVCGDCEYKEVCQVCGAAAQCETGNLTDRPVYICEYTKAIVKELEEQQ